MWKNPWICQSYYQKGNRGVKCLLEVHFSRLNLQSQISAHQSAGEIGIWPKLIFHAEEKSMRRTWGLPLRSLECIASEHNRRVYTLAVHSSSVSKEIEKYWRYWYTGKREWGMRANGNGHHPGLSLWKTDESGPSCKLLVAVELSESSIRVALCWN